MTAVTGIAREMMIKFWGCSLSNKIVLKIKRGLSILDLAPWSPRSFHSAGFGAIFESMFFEFF